MAERHLLPARPLPEGFAAASRESAGKGTLGAKSIQVFRRIIVSKEDSMLLWLPSE
ncbi:MAG: hypothetical protein Q9173_001228 [Seirophora scorigena]